MREKLKGLLNLAKKAGYLIIGSEKLSTYSKKMYFLLADKNAGKSTKKIFENFKNRGVLGAEIENLGELISVEKCMIIGIKNLGLSEQIKKYINQGE